MLQAFKYRLLAERKESDERFGHRVGAYDLTNALVARIASIPALTAVPSQVLQDVARRLDTAFQAFFRRVKVWEKPGYPRLKPLGRDHSFIYPQGTYTAHDGWVYLSKIGAVKITRHRPNFVTIQACTTGVRSGRYSAVCYCEVDPTLLPWSERALGIDVGLKIRAATSDGEVVEANPFLRKSERPHKKKARQVTTNKHGSNGRKKRVRAWARIHEPMAINVGTTPIRFGGPWSIRTER